MLSKTSELTQQEVSNLKKDYTKLFKDIKSNISKIDQKRKLIIDKIIKNNCYESPERNKMIQDLKILNKEIEENHNSKNSILNLNSKNMPSIVRRHFAREIKDGKL